MSLDKISDLLGYTYDEIMNMESSDSDRGYLYDSMWKLISSYNPGCMIVDKNKYEYGRINKDKTFSVIGYNSVINDNIRSGPDGGIDVALRYMIRNEYHYEVFSSKFFANDESHSIEDYDINKMIAVTTNMKNVTYGLLVNDGIEVKNKLERSRQPEKNRVKYIFSKDDLRIIFNRTVQNIRSGIKPGLNIRIHQKYIIDRVNECFKDNKYAIIAAKPRSGKTIMMGVILTNYNHIMITTSTPTENMSQYIEILRKYQIFGEYNIVELNKYIKDNKYIGEFREKNIFLASKQFLDYHNRETKITDLPNIELLVFDENDFGGTTFNSKSIIDNINPDKILFLTATPNKTIVRFRLKNEQIFRWDMKDSHNLAFGIDEVTRESRDDFIINERLIEIVKSRPREELQYYRDEPKLNLVTPLYTETIKTIITKHSIDDYGFSCNTLFSLNKEKTGFNYVDDIKNIISYIFGSNRRKLLLDSEKKCILDRTGETKRNILIYLPENNIAKISKYFKLLLDQDPVAGDYHKICINSENKHEWGNENIGEKLNQMAKESIHGVIVLVGKMLKRAISLPDFNIALIMNDSTGCDQYVQTIYRVLTESKNKRIGHIFDFVPGRFLSTCFNMNGYSINNTKDKEIIFKMINIDGETIVHKDENYSDKLQSLLEEAEDYITHISNNNIFQSELDIIIAREEFLDLRKLYTLLKERKETKDFIKSMDNEGMINKGKVKSPGTMARESKYKKMLDWFFKFAIWLTKNLDDDTEHISNIFDLLINHEDLGQEYSFMIDPTGTIPVNDLFSKLKKIIEDGDLDNNKKIKKFIHEFRYQLNNCIESEDNYIEIIRMMMGDPSRREIAERSEVYTPIWLVEEMLDKLPEDVWNNPNIKWLEPGCGMSPFAYYIYKRLMERLICIEEEEREDYILKNMIYLNDINRRNIIISRRIFNYKIPLDHIFMKSFLDMKMEDITDNSTENLIVIGNPPYNSGFGRGVKPIYNLFIEHCIDNCRILSFIIPAKWFVGAGKGLDNFKKMMLSRNDMTMIKEFKAPGEIFLEIDLKGGVCYFIKDKNHVGKCDFNGKMIYLNNRDNLLDNISDSIIQKVKSDKMLIDILRIRGYYGIESNDSRMHPDEREGDIKCYVSIKNGEKLYINKEEIKRDIDKYKVLTPAASGKGDDGFGRIFISTSDEVHSQSFISFHLESEKEVISLLSYLKTNFTNYLLSLLKITHNISKKTLSYIPLVPLIYNEKPIEWTDASLFKYFKLDETEQKIILDYNMSKNRVKSPGKPKRQVKSPEEPKRQVKSLEEPKRQEKSLEEPKRQEKSPEELDKDKLSNSRERNGYTKEKLIDECKKRNIRVLTKYKKADLVDLLLKTM